METRFISNTIILIIYKFKIIIYFLITKLGYLNTTVLRSNSKGLPSKIKLPGYDNEHKNEILIQKYKDNNNIFCY